jgi:hypothetical protein
LFIFYIGFKKPSEKLLSKGLDCFASARNNGKEKNAMTGKETCSSFRFTELKASSPIAAFPQKASQTFFKM